MPGVDLPERVGTQQEDQRHLGTALGADLGQRVVRVGGPGAAQLPVVHVEARVALRGELHHRQALFGAGVRPGAAVIGQSRGQEDHPLQLEGLGELGGKPQVSEVDGIERPAE